MRRASSVSAQKVLVGQHWRGRGDRRREDFVVEYRHWTGGVIVLCFVLVSVGCNFVFSLVFSLSSFFVFLDFLDIGSFFWLRGPAKCTPDWSYLTGLEELEEWGL